MFYVSGLFCIKTINKSIFKNMVRGRKKGTKVAKVQKLSAGTKAESTDNQPAVKRARKTGTAVATAKKSARKVAAGSTDIENEPGPQVHRVKWKVKKRMLKKKTPAPDRILKVTKEQYDAAIEYLDAPDTKCQSHSPGGSLCTFNTLIWPSANGGDLYDQVMSDNFMFQEMTNCLEKGDLSGFLAIETGAFATRKSRLLRNDLICVSTIAFCRPDYLIEGSSPFRLHSMRCFIILPPRIRKSSNGALSLY